MVFFFSGNGFSFFAVNVISSWPKTILLNVKCIGVLCCGHLTGKRTLLILNLFLLSVTATHLFFSAVLLLLQIIV